MDNAQEVVATCKLLKEARVFDKQTDAMQAAFEINQKFKDNNINKTSRIDGGIYVGYWLLVWKTDIDADICELVGLVAAD